MASRELRKKRGAVTPSPARKTGLKEKEERVIVQPAPRKSRVDNEPPKPDTKVKTLSSEDVQEENTKDTGQEKDGGTTKTPGKVAPKGPSVMDSPRYMKSPRDKSHERSSSPFMRNIVQPLPGPSPELNASQGSLASLRSAASSASKEAWPERKGSVSTVATRKDSVSSQVSRPSSGKGEKIKTTETKVDAVSIKADEKEQNAYIPYTYARNCIARITGDMTDMKAKHLHIVRDIEKHYRAIEDETQLQFNGFVLMLRNQYTGKVSTFRQVIELHRNEQTRKEQYWQETLESLTERVNKLLKDRKILLVSNREEVEKLETEKVQLMAQLTSQMDQEKSATTVISKDFEKKVSELKEENQKLQDSLESEKKEVERLKGLLAAGTAVAVANVAQDKEEAKQENATMERSAPTTDKPSDEEQRQMSGERQRMSEDMGRMGEERQDLVDKIKDLQAEITRISVESGEWQEKYRLLLIQAGDSEKLREQYATLESQYKALALVVSSSPETSQVAEEKASQVESERAMMEEEKQRLAKEIEKWEKEFKKKNKREPTEDEKPDSAKELYVSMGEVTQMVESLECQKATLEAVQSGAPPPTPELPATSAAIAEPEVSVVEVKVPDPAIVASLEKSQAAVDDLQSRITALEEENAQLRSQIADLQAGQPITAVAAAALVQGDDSEKVDKLTSELENKESELEKLRAEKREMSKDMKKMMRQHMKLQAKMGEVDPDLPRLLEMVAVLVQSVHGEHHDAGRAMEKRLNTAKKAVEPLSEEDTVAKKALSAWDKTYKKAHGAAPDDSDRDEEGQALKATSEDTGKALDIKQLEIRALALLTTGIYKPKEPERPKSASRATPETDVEQQLSALDNKMIDLEGERDTLQEENNKLQTSVQDLEAELSDMREQLAAQATMTAATSVTASSEDVSELEREIDGLNVALQQERAAHDATREELETVQRQLQQANDELSALQGQSDAQVQKATAVMEANLASKEEQLADLKKRNEELEKERLANVPLDTAKEIKNLQNKIAVLEKEKEEKAALAASQGSVVAEVKTQLDLANKALEAQRATNRDLEGRVKGARAEKEKAVKELNNQLDKKEQQKALLETKLKQLQAAGGAAVASTVAVKSAGTRAGPGAKGGASNEEVAALKREIRELKACIKQLETEARRGGVGVAGDGGASERNQQKRHEKILKELEKRCEIEQNKTAKLTEAQKAKDEELKTLQKDCREKEAELVKLRAELSTLGVAAKEGVEAAGKVKGLEVENKKLTEENMVLLENFNSERVLRKKYYNMVEDMKGKIRVYCRARPLSTSEKDRGNFSVLKSPDEYTLQVQSQRGLKEFQYDQIFMEESTQEKVFEDTYNLIQSAVDGYNVCIFAYGQTGSGKTFTMIGDKEQRFPGVAPRAFNRIFEMVAENRSKFDMRVTAYMLELYNEKLIDLFGRPNTYDEDKLDIKKDKKGMVFVHGAVVKEAANAKELNALFEEGSKNRHTASTKMNADSSRSHLVISIVLESTNKATGNVVKGKLSLVDLAGSERVGKTGASAEQLKEAMSINKSLSALGDVISALSSEQSFIPYRNNKLTMLMQDSLGGNAKTLMFVNISPADYNADESIISLTYASRVKLITNDASKNADNKEIARLKAVIAKLKMGEKVDEEEIA
ncbi:hypothetical protein V1264_001974 [Littorina saxatilis]|uniref:Kinesin motor domain-containing protein n=1 Tax=Littorina saxatilis TaxID=31220 RepID=A0AAN9C433_9CAEN